MAVVVGTAQGKLTLDARTFITNIDSSYKSLKSFYDLIEDTQNALKKLPTQTTLGLDTTGSFGGSNSGAGFDVSKLTGANTEIKNATDNVDLLKEALNVGLTGALNGIATLAQTTFSAFTSYTKEVVGFAKESLEFGTEFDATMSQVGAIAKADGDDLEALRNKAIDMGEQTKFSAAEAAQGMVYMGMAGWDTEQIISGLDGVMNLAAASGEDLATTSDIVTDALTAFGLKAEDATHFADVLAEASTDSNTNVALMGETFKYAASMAGTMKYSIEDTAVAIGLMANTGIKGSQAGTSLRNIISNLAAPTDKSAAAMSALGISLVDQEGNTKSLMDVMKDLRSAFSEVTADKHLQLYQEMIESLNADLEAGTISQEDYDDAVNRVSTDLLQSVDTVKAGYANAIAGKYGLSGFLAIVNATDEDFQKLTNSIYTSSTSLDAVTQAAENSGVVWENYLSDAQIASKGIEDIAADITYQIQGLEKTNEEVQEHLQLKYGLNADDALKAIWSVQDAFEDTQGAASKMSEKMLDNLQGSITYFQSAMGTLKIRVSDVLKGPAKDITNFGTDVIKRLTASLTKEGIPGLIREVGAVIPDIAVELAQYIPEILPPLIAGFWALVDGVIDALPEAAPVVVNGAVTLFMGLATGLDEAAERLLPQIPGIIELICGAIDDNSDEFLDTALDLFLNLVEGAIKALPEIIKTAAKLVKKIVKALLDHKDEVIQAAIDLFVAIIEGLTDPETITALIGAVGEIVGYIVNGLTSPEEGYTWLQVADKIFSGLGDGLLNIFEGALGAIDELLGTNLAGWAADVHAWFDDLKQQSFEFGKAMAESMNKTENELNTLEAQYGDTYQSMLRYYADLMKQGIEAQDAMALAYQKYFTSAEAQYVFRERYAGSLAASGDVLAQRIGTEGMTNQQVVDMLSRAVTTTGNTYNFYSPEVIDEKKAADEIRKANEETLLGQ